MIIKYIYLEVRGGAGDLKTDFTERNPKPKK